MTNLEDALLDIAAAILRLEVATRARAYVVLNKNAWTNLLHEINANSLPGLSTLNISTNFNLGGVKFILNHRPEPTCFTTQAGDIYPFATDLGLVRSITFSDNTTWDAVDGWK